MIRVFNVYFPKRTLLLFVTEFALICGALLTAAFLRFGPSATLVLGAQYGYTKLGLVAFICVLSLYLNDLYNPSSAKDSLLELSRSLCGVGFACLAVAAIYRVLPSVRLFDGFVGIGCTIVLVGLLVNRQVFFAFNKSKELTESVVILGEGRLASTLASAIESRPELGMTLVGYIGKEWPGDQGIRNPRRLGGIADLTNVANQMQIRRIIVAMGDQRRKLPLDELLALKTAGVSIQDGTDFYEATTGKLPVETLRMSWLVFSPGFRVSRLTLAYKRIVSVVLAVAGLVLLSPFLAIIAIAIRLDSRGPVIFRQTRIGFGGNPFTMFKFRTMHLTAEEGGCAKPVVDNDQRITRVGRFLRRFRIDEIPQLYNILRGQMYLVGPRPFVPEQELDCVHRIPLYAQRWTVRPGATGWAQVQRGYCVSLLDNIDKLSYDLFYIKNMSIGFDLLIIFKTIKIVLLAQGGR